MPPHTAQRIAAASLGSDASEIASSIPTLLVTMPAQTARCPYPQRWLRTTPAMPLVNDWPIALSSTWSK
jgi:hypothetical protein